MHIAVSKIDPSARDGARSLRKGVARLRDLIALTKPRVMSLAVFTSLVGELAAPGRLGPVIGAIAVLCIALGAGAAGTLNMWWDADIDAMMRRTAGRPIPSGRITRAQALAFGLGSAIVAVALLGAIASMAAAVLLAFAIFFYAVVYTIWLKRRTPQNIVIGGAAGALPPMIGWAAASGDLAVEPIVLFLIIFLWTPPHFWSLAIGRCEEYARANIPMLPVVAGKAATKKWIVIYSVLLFPISLSPWVFGFARSAYGVIAALLGVTMIFLASRLLADRQDNRAPAYRLFAFSIIYLFALFSALMVDALSRGG